MITQALNRHPGSHRTTSSAFPSFRVGVSEDRNKKCRRTMEDSHSFVYDFGGVIGQGYFAVFECVIFFLAFQLAGLT
jgi:protein phosphatase PTC1